MPVAIVRFREILGKKCMRQMAIDASSGSVVRALQPRSVLIVHDVTVRAGTRVRGEITPTLPVVERKQPNTGNKPDETRQQHTVGNQRPHARIIVGDESDISALFPELPAAI